MKPFLPTVVLRFILFAIFCAFLGGCASDSNPGVAGDVFSGVLMGIGTGLSGL